MTKIINITEEEIYRIVKKVLISEQNENLKFYVIPGNYNTYLTVKDGDLYGADKQGKRYIPIHNFNGNINEFKVNVYPTGQKDVSGNPKWTATIDDILNKNFRDNAFYAREGQLENEYGLVGGVNVANDFRPMQTRTDFGFFGITPPNTRSGAGIPRYYTANVMVKPISILEANGKTETNEKNVVSPFTYQKLGKFGKKKKLGVTIDLYPGPNAREIIETPEEPVIITISLQITDPFEFNKTELYPESETQINDFINRILGHLNNTEYGQRYRDFLNSNPISIKAYASIDDDPEQEITYVEGRNSVEGCGGTKLRKEYNECLSQKRAEKIKNLLLERLGDISIDAIGLGETDKFAPGKKWPSTKNTEETKPNRAVQIVVPNFRTS